jgi:hypothetical protein
VTFNKGVALLYTSVAPLLNPLIYTLRNQQVKEAFKHMLQRFCSFKNKEAKFRLKKHVLGTWMRQVIKSSIIVGLIHAMSLFEYLYTINFTYMLFFTMVYLLYFIFSVLRFALKGSCLLGRCSATWVTPSLIFFKEIILISKRNLPSWVQHIKVYLFSESVSAHKW